MAFDLSSITKGRGKKPPRIIIYGEHGLGKSTFAAGAPSPVFIQTEDGLEAIDTSKFPLCKTYDDVIGWITTLYKEEHEYKTVVLDSVDWLEQLIEKKVTSEYSEQDRGYGKDQVLVSQFMRKALDGLNALRSERGMAVIVTAHCRVRRFDDPAGDSYDRFELKLGKRTNALVQEWADVIGFAAHKVHVVTTEEGFNKKIKRGKDMGRVLNLQRTPAFDAKDRYGMPAEIDLSWDAFSSAFANASAK